MSFRKRNDASETLNGNNLNPWDKPQKDIPACREIFSESCKYKQNLDCNLTFFLNDLAPIGNKFGDKSIGKVLIQSKFGLDQRVSGSISLRVRTDWSVIGYRSGVSIMK